MSYICLSSGRILDLENPGNWNFQDIENDIAASLSRISRFSGNTLTPGFVSVAEHSLWLIEMNHHLAKYSIPETRDNLEFELGLLFHDAHEIMLNDPPSPVKSAVQEEVAHHFDLALYEHMYTNHHIEIYDLNHTSIKKYDRLCQLVEIRAFMHPNLFAMAMDDTKYEEVMWYFHSEIDDLVSKRRIYHATYSQDGSQYCHTMETKFLDTFNDLKRRLRKVIAEQGGIYV